MTQIGTHGFALAFDTSLSMQEMLSNLNLRIPQWNWINWQSDRWGDYIRGNAKTEGDAWFKILYDDEIKRWAVDVSFKAPLADADTIAERLRAFVTSQLLPVVDAIDVAALQDSY